MMGHWSFVRSAAPRASALVTAAAALSIAALASSGDVSTPSYSGEDAIVLHASPGFRAELSPAGAALFPGSRAHRYTLSARRMGCEGELRALPRAVIERNGDRAEARREEAGLVEWYADSPSGIEQGFTLAARPPCRGSGALVLEMALGGGLVAVVPEGSLSAVLKDERGRPLLGYSGLVAKDARGRSLAARMEAEPGLLRLRVDDAGARYPLVIDPWIGALESKLTANDAKAHMRFGSTVAISGDTAVVGTDVQLNSKDGAEPGNRLYVLVRQNDVWSQEAEILPDPDAGNPQHFGSSIAVFGDTIVVGSEYQAQADVFVRKNGVWTHDALLEPVDPDSGTAFISDVALHDQTAVVASANGGVYVFVRSGGAWSQQAKLTPVGDSQGGFHSVAVFGDTVAFGDTPGTDGEVHVFVRQSGTWSEEAKLSASRSDSQLRGRVALAGDTLLAGGYPGPIVFARKNGAWAMEAQLVPAGYGSTSFGALSGDTVLLPEVVARDTDGGPQLSSIVVAVYRRTAGDWSKESELALQDAQPSFTDGAIALSGETAILGSSTAGEDETGAAYILSVRSEPDKAGCACQLGRSTPSSGLAPFAAAALAFAISRRRRRIG